jgi:hypothetical protein
MTIKPKKEVIYYKEDAVQRPQRQVTTKCKYSLFYLPIMVYVIDEIWPTLDRIYKDDPGYHHLAIV